MSANEPNNPMPDGAPEGAGRGLPDRGGSPPAEQYLWDGTGAVDAGVAKAEALLRPLRHHGDLPAAVDLRRPQRGRLVSLCAAVAAVLVVVVGVRWWLATPAGPERIGAWTIAERRGDVEIGDLQQSKTQHTPTSRAVAVGRGGLLRLTAGDSQVTLPAGSRARIAAAKSNDAEAWVAIDGGRATVHRGEAPVGVALFGRGVELSRGATGEVMVGGSSAEVTITGGSAAIDAGSDVPVRMLAGMVCRVDEAGARTPLRTDVARDFNKSVQEAVMVAKKEPALSAAAVERACKMAEESDLATLWNMAWRVDPAVRGPIIQRLAMETGLMKSKFDVSAAAKGDRAAMDELWDAVARQADASKPPRRSK